MSEDEHQNASAIYDVGGQTKEKPWRCVCGLVLGQVIRRNNIRALRLVCDEFSVTMYSGDVICSSCGQERAFNPGEEYVNSLIERRRRLTGLVDEL